jgi:hypothetical protein
MILTNTQFDKLFNLDWLARTYSNKQPSFNALVNLNQRFALSDHIGENDYEEYIGNNTLVLHSDNANYEVNSNILYDMSDYYKIMADTLAEAEKIKEITLPERKDLYEEWNSHKIGYTNYNQFIDSLSKTSEKDKLIDKAIEAFSDRFGTYNENFTDSIKQLILAPNSEIKEEGNKISIKTGTTEVVFF